ncbi:MAG: hypothetical protein V1789_08225 [PVC group bacterium]
MKRPTWATVVGVLGIILGCLGIIGGGQLMIFPKIMEIQKEMFSDMKESFEKSEGNAGHQARPKEMFKIFEKMWNVPHWYGTWCVIAGVLSLLVSGFYLFASIRLLQVKPSAISMFYYAAGVSIFLTLVKGLVGALTQTASLGMVLVFGGLFSVVVNLVLIIVVATSDREAFIQQKAQPL